MELDIHHLTNDSGSTVSSDFTAKRKTRKAITFYLKLQTCIHTSTVLLQEPRIHALKNISESSQWMNPRFCIQTKLSLLVLTLFQIWKCVTGQQQLETQSTNTFSQKYSQLKAIKSKYNRK